MMSGGAAQLLVAGGCARALDGTTLVSSSRRLPREAIAKAEAGRGNAARLVSTPTLLLCRHRVRRVLAGGAPVGH
jgi:hypothetical protein